MTLGRGLYGLPEPEKPVRPPSRIRWLIRIPLIIVVMVGISLTTLFVIGGKSDSMKANLESYLNDTTGMESHIETLNGVHFFPVMGFDAENITLKSGGETKVSIGGIRVYIPFWNTLLSRSEFRDFHVAGAVIEAGIITPRRIEIDQLTIDRLKSAEPILVLNGRYGGDPVSMRIDLKSRLTGSNAIPVYSLAENAVFEGQAGDMILKGAFLHPGTRRASIHLDEFKAGGNFNSLKAVMALSPFIGGTVESGQSKGNYTIDLDRKEAILKIRGAFDAERLNPEDLSGSRGLVQSWRAVKQFYSGPDRDGEMEPASCDLGGTDMSVQVSVQTLLQNGVEQKDASGVIEIQDGRVIQDTLNLIPCQDRLKE